MRVPAWTAAGWTRHAATAAGLTALSVVAYLLLKGVQGDRGQVVLLVVVWAIALTGLNLITGLGGYPSLAHVSFFGGGAYLSAYLLGKGLPMALCALLAVGGTMLAGLVVALVFSRTRGQYFAIGTMFFTAVTNLVLTNAAGVTGGPNGRPVDLGFSLDTTLVLLAASLGLSLGAFYVLSRSRFGDRLRAIREDEDLAQHVGVPTARVKLIAMVVSSAFGAWAGVLFAQYNGVIAPSQFTFVQGFLMLVAIGLGGGGRLLAPLVGSAVVIGFTQLIKLGPGVSQIVLGVLFILVTLLVPNGILGGITALWRRPRPAVPDVPAAPARAKEVAS
ncbi:leucine/isoleucine/valine transporter permease subunit [Actinomadura rubteroloni]|uniref:Leucine/isoleucine/valine transporter permease subunit n=1 Tax=Actinomadura rubteroloni TaxID=1926885 RepID=A0A2P4UD79_9ACTN|nr:branched-chain amino acid ABC transporter permease [Actinomadura rubteroloni]POM22997.1 leucine/isoleucine/valine transporter permease subunit [Actinomadura rubteroloni]